MDSKKILESAHTLIAGSTGSGKSVLLHRVLCDAISTLPESAGEFYLIDLKRGVEFCDYIGLPQVTRFCINAEQALDALADAVAIMERRLDAMRMMRVKMYQGRDLWVVIDEMGFLMQTARKAALPLLTQITQQGRAARVHLIMATQNPGRSSKTGIPAEMQQNMTLKIGLHCTTATESRQIVGVSGCEALPAHGKILVWEGGFITRDSVEMFGDADRAAVLARYRRQRA